MRALTATVLASVAALSVLWVTQPRVAAVVTGLWLLPGVVLVVVLVGSDTRRRLVARWRARRGGQGATADDLYWLLWRPCYTDDRIGLPLVDRWRLLHAARPPETGAGSHSPAVLVRWLTSTESPHLLAAAVRAGYDDTELTAHLDGHRPLDPDAVFVLAALHATAAVA